MNTEKLTKLLEERQPKFYSVMSDEEFLEKLIRLAWDNGYLHLYEYAIDEEYWVDFNSEYLLVYYISQVGRHDELIREINIERIIFDHDFIRVLCDLAIRKHNLGTEPDISEHIFDGFLDVATDLALSTDRVKYLRETFGSLI